MRANSRGFAVAVCLASLSACDLIQPSGRDAGHVHEHDAGPGGPRDAGHMHELDSGVAMDAGHMHGLDAGVAMDAGHMHGLDAGVAMDAGHMHEHDAGVAMDAGHMHELDAGVAMDAGHMHPVDAGSPDAGGPMDAGHMHGVDAGRPDAGGSMDAGHTHPGDGGSSDAGGTDAGHMHGVDAGGARDAGSDAGQPRTRVRLWGSCFLVCTTSADPDGDGFGFEQNQSCVMPGSTYEQNAPWCETRLSATPYEPPPVTVTQTTQQVATLPRPPVVPEPPATNCPHQRTDLVAFNPAWLSAAGDLTIPANTRVRIAGNTDLPSTRLIKTFTIPVSSEVVFADVPATYRFRDVRVYGALRMGSTTCRLTSSIELLFDTDENVADAGVRQLIFDRMGLGLVLEDTGTLELFGKLYQPTWTRLATTAMSGTSTLQLAEAVDWEPGQQLVVVTSSTRDYPMSDQNEVRTIATVNGTTVTLTTPLSFQHYGGAEYQVEVGLLTRNIVLRTAPTVLAQAPTFGGHVMAHGGLTRISGVQLIGLGQQNFVDRYPMHWHFAGELTNGSYFADSTVQQSNWRCAVVHRTDRALITRNVAFDNFGHCFYLEDGVEFDNELSFNLAAKTKIMGSTSTSDINTIPQQGFTRLDSPDMVQPADRAASGFYIPNGNNRLIGNASSGGFSGYSFPNLPRALGGSPERIFPFNYAVSHFDGNTAHTAGYLWDKGGCIYAGGVLRVVTVAGQPRLEYQSGRPASGNDERPNTDVFGNSKLFLCNIGVAHWGKGSRLVNTEIADSSLLASVFGQASIQSAVVLGRSNNSGVFIGYRRGFQFYDSWTLTLLKDLVFRDFQPASNAGSLPSQDNCAFFSMVHSDEWVPQRMSTTARVFYDNVADSQRFCHDNTGTLSSRNFNFIDSDGTATGRPTDGLPAGPRMVGASFTNAWRISPSCGTNPDWNLTYCPLTGTQNVAAVAVTPKMGTRVTVYDFNGTVHGDTWYSTTQEFAASQIAAPSRRGWHHRFVGAVPPTVPVWAYQVPANDFVVVSFWLPTGVSCSVNRMGWLPVANLQALLNSTGAVYTTDRNACFVRIPRVDNGTFTASGLSIPVQAWEGMSTLSNFVITTGCTSTNPACAGPAPMAIPSMVGIVPPP
jgi:hypothetical protein